MGEQDPDKEEKIAIASERVVSVLFSKNSYSRRRLHIPRGDAKFRDISFSTDDHEAVPASKRCEGGDQDYTLKPLDTFPDSHRVWCSWCVKQFYKDEVKEDVPDE